MIKKLIIAKLSLIYKMHYLYIIESAQLQRYYIGSTSQTPEERLKRHLSSHKGYTAKSNDWKIVYTETFQTLSEARKREYQIKNWKSSLRIKELISRNATE